MPEIDLTQNAFLAALRQDDRERLAPHITLQTYQKDDVLHESYIKPQQTWFPCGAALASYLITDFAGKTTETAMIGREGLIGGLTTDGHGCTFPRAVVRVSGNFLRIHNNEMEKAREASTPLRRMLARYADCLVAQVFQEIACSKTHSVTQRAAKWLLEAQMRTGEDRLQMTQENMADLLGVGRTFVNRVISQLRNEGLIETRRGYIHIKNMSGLRGMSCDCHHNVAGHFKSMFSEEPSACC